MAQRETLDWKKIDPDAPLTFQLIFDRNQKDDGHNEKGGFDWHRYTCKINGNEMVVFTPHEAVHDLLQEVGISKKGDVFTITKKAEYNNTTGKHLIYYEIEVNGEVRSTKDPIPPAKTVTQKGEQPKASIPKKQEDISDESKFEAVFNHVMDVVLKYAEKRAPEATDKMTPEQYAQLIVDLVPKVSTMVNTLVIQNGKR